MRFHGLLVLKIWIRTYKSDPSLCEDVSFYLFIYFILFVLFVLFILFIIIISVKVLVMF